MKLPKYDNYRIIPAGDRCFLNGCPLGISPGCFIINLEFQYNKFDRFFS